MSKFCVKKPYTVLVGVILVLVLGIVSFTKLSTDLLPTISLPYIVVVTTYPGASPERVEAEVTEPLETELGTVNGVENVRSTSNENYSMIMLEFVDDTNMDSAMVKVSTQVDQLELPDNVAKPMLMEISPDLLATMYAAVDYEGRDIYELSEFTEDEIIPYLERQEGVAGVDATGLVEKTVEIRLNEDKIDKVNDKIRGVAEDKLDDAQKELDDGKQELADAKSKLHKSEKELADKQKSTSDELAEASKALDEAMANKAAYGAQQTTLEAEKKALEMEKKAYKDNKVEKNLQKIEDGFTTAREKIASKETYDMIYQAVYQKARIAAVQEAIGGAGMAGITVDETNIDTVLAMLPAEAVAQMEATLAETCAGIAAQQQEEQLAKIPENVKDAIDNPDKLKNFRKMLKDQGQKEAADQMTKKNLETLYNIVHTRIPQIDTELANMEIELMATTEINKAVTEATTEADDAYLELEAGKIAAAAGFGSGNAQIAAGLSKIEEGEEKLKDAQKQLDDTREEALKNANLDQLLTMDTLSQMITAENFNMPAGYIEKEGDQKILVKIGDEFDAVDQVEDMLLTKIDKIGDIRISDVADVVTTDNSEDSYTSLNGADSVILAINKASTAGTADVAKVCNTSIDELEAKYPGLHITPLMDQGDYIGLIVNSVLSNLIWGAILAIFVLAIFLKDFRPTVVVAFSIPMSVLFAIVLMYFSGITLNIISLSGLALGVGMLVDNSIVVIENIYRLRSKGISAARAAVMGAKQVAGAIAASTLTTICVFLPIVFTTGMTRDIFTDMALTIGYSLVASLIVALTVVPTMGATVLKESRQKEHRLFDKAMKGYAKLLSFCLRRKIVPLAVAITLLAICVIKVASTGIVFLPQMGGNQMSMDVTAPAEMSVSEAYEMADGLMEKVMKIPGIETVGMMSGGGSTSLLSTGSNKAFSLFILLTDKQGKDNPRIAKDLEKLMDSEYKECEYTVTTSNMDLSALVGDGMQVDVFGDDIDTMLSVSEDIMELLSSIKGFEEVSNGQEEADDQLHVIIDKDKAMRLNLTVAQVFAELSGKLTTTKDSTKLETDSDSYQITLVNKTKPLTEENLRNYEFKVKKTDDDGKEKEEIHHLSEFARIEKSKSIASISRENQGRKIEVTAKTAEGYNTTLLSRQVEAKLATYKVPEGMRVEVAGETVQIKDMMKDMVLMILLAIVFIYLIMVAQFQSLLSPFIVIFTIPLAFTGGFLGLMLTGESLSMIAMMGFLILSGVVVNNGIVFVDYVNQLRLEGMEKRDALVETGVTRMRPILMTAMTTILANSTLALSRDASAVMSRGMVIVTIFGLSYATLMTLFIVPVMYDIFFRRKLEKVDLGDENDWSEA
ncbi:MAG: efflux RND transporter permease subunit [Lachnospiraceae bacterium]|nr:efflux RND transporter permease subunit [Lachnospiraceae bacterium]